MTESEALSVMIPPSKRRPKMMGGIMQIHVTRACDKSCYHCTQGSNLGGKPVMMSLEEFELACQSLAGWGRGYGTTSISPSAASRYFGVVAMFGGNPAMSPYFEEMCKILRGYFPYEQRGLWCNHPLGKGTVMRETFNPYHSNLNVHLDQSAYDEFARDWPECRPYLKGLHQDSRHSPPYVAMMDVGLDEGKRWELISQCRINKEWSAMICSIPGREPNRLRGYFCEIAGAQAMLHSDNPEWPDIGVDIANHLRLRTDGLAWWQLPMVDFKDQVRWHCHRCGVPLQRYGELAIGGELSQASEEVSTTHVGVYHPKRKGRKVSLITVDSAPAKTLANFTRYLENSKI